MYQSIKYVSMLNIFKGCKIIKIFIKFNKYKKKKYYTMSKKK